MKIYILFLHIYSFYNIINIGDDMNIIDVIVILVIVSCMVAGFKRGFTRELVSAVGFFLVVALSYILKNPISVFLYEHLPFFNFAGIIKGVTALNIFLYFNFLFLGVPRS